MTRRLGGIGSKSLAAMASLSLAATLAGGFAITGCGGDNNPTTSDAGGDAGADAPADNKVPDGTMEAAPDAPKEVGPDVTMDVTPPPDVNVPDMGMMGMDAGPACMPPTFMPNGGGILAGTNVTIVPPSGFPSNGVIYYTTDMTQPFHTANMGSSPIYSGPIQVSQPETIQAIAYAPGNCTDSSIATASFTITAAEAGTLQPPVFNPQSVTRNNDFLLGLSSSAGATICYTLDGVTTPTCNVTATSATCSGNSQTYNAATQISINGSISNTTDPAKVGQVTVQAIACQPGFASTVVDTTMGSQTYTLEAAAPTMINPQPPAAGSFLAYKTAGYGPTISSATNGSSIQYTTDGTSMPTCGVGSPGTNIAAASGTTQPSGTVSFTGTTVVNAIACKSGYAPSAMPDTMTYTVKLNPPGFTNGTGTYDNTVAPGLAAIVGGTTPIQNPTGSYVCYSTSGAAGCGTPGANPASGMCASGSTNEAATASSITATGTTLNAVTCTPSASYTSSDGMAAQTYTLTLDQPYLNPPDTTTPTTPSTSYAIPANMTMLTPTIGQSQPGSSAGRAPGFWCVSIGTTTAPPTQSTCGTNACMGGGTLIAYNAAPPSIGTAVSASSVVIAVSCPAPGDNFGSNMTTVTYGGPNSAAPPTITQIDAVTLVTANTGLNYDPITAILTNKATGTDHPTMCYSTSTTPTCTSAATPTCSGTTVTTNYHGSALDAAGAATVTDLLVVNGGSGYSSSAPPVVTISAPGGSGGTATATATVNGSGVVTGFTFVSHGSGYTSATVSITGGGGTGATAIAVTSNQAFVTPLSTDPTTLTAVACTTSQQQNGSASATYDFQVQEPNFGTTATATDLNGGGNVNGNDSIHVWTASQFGSETIHYTTTPNQTANCGSGTVIGSGSGTVTVPQGSTSFYLSAIGCSATQQASANARSQTFTVGTAAPSITTDQITSGANAGVPQSPWENTFNATITSTTSTATICYNVNGAAGCGGGGGCNGASTPLTNGGSVAVTRSETINAVACSGTLGSSGPASQAFVLQFPAVVIQTNPANATCPAASLAFTIGLDTSTAATNLGGPTKNATLCWSIDNSTITNCTPSAGHVTCGSTGAAGSTTQAIGSFAASQGVNYEVCSPSGATFTGSGAQASGTATVTPPYAASGSVTIDGTNQGTSEWPAADTFAGNGGTTGYFTFDANNLYFATTYDSTTFSAAGDDLVIYLGDAGTGATPGSTTGPSQLGSPAAPFAASWAFAWNTNSAGSTVSAYAYSNGTWAPAGFGSNITVGFRTGGFVEFQLPRNAITFANQTVNTSGGVLTGVGGTTPAEPSVWPTGGTNHYVQTVLNACAGPTLQ